MFCTVRADELPEEPTTNSFLLRQTKRRSEEKEAGEVGEKEEEKTGVEPEKRGDKREKRGDNRGDEADRKMSRRSV